MTSALFEACVESLAETRDAAACSADRVELCVDLAHDGCTPSAALAAQCVATGIPVVAMIRPRTGDFSYSGAEVEAMCGAMSRLKASGVSGFATGALSASGAIDDAAMTRLLAAAGELPVTFHRAFDQLGNLDRGLDTLIDLGVRRVLTSGGAPSAVHGIGVLRRLVERAAERIEVVAAGSVRPFNVNHVVTATGAPAVHARWSGWREASRP